MEAPHATPCYHLSSQISPMWRNRYTSLTPVKRFGTARPHCTPRHCPLLNTVHMRQLTAATPTVIGIPVWRDNNNNVTRA